MSPKKQTKRVKSIFWMVDVQNDFMKKGGSLYIEGAEKIIPNLVANLKTFTDLNYSRIFTMDWHFENSEELSSEPNFETTFPNHCMAESEGAKLITEIAEKIPEDTEVINWNEFYNYQDLCEISKNKDIILTKDKFDIFAGNPFADKLIEILKLDVAYVCGVATNVCVDFAVMGLLERGVKVYVLTTAIKGLPNLPVSDIVDKWVSNGATLIN